MPTARGGSRRQTLGVVSNTAPNRHDNGDLPPNSAQKGSRNTRSKSRKSMIPRVGRDNRVPPPSPGLAAPTQASSSRRKTRGDNNRRTTMSATEHTAANYSPMRSALPPAAAAAPPPVVRTDPRPIHDKGFQQDCIKKLLNYLLQSGYEYPVSQKCLARPSGRDFAQIVTFLLRKIDPSFQQTTGSSVTSNAKDSNAMKLEDEIAMNFKALGYPIPVSKTALVAAGSTHTWPTLLAALVWLVELLEVLEEDVDEEIVIEDSKPFETLQELQINTDKVFFSFLEKSYNAFMAEDEQMQRDLQQALTMRFEQDDGYIEQEIERMTDLNATIVEQMNKMIQDTDELPLLIKKQEDFKVDLEQFRDLNRQLDDHVSGLQQKIKKFKEDLAAKNKILEKKNETIEHLKKTLGSQDLSKGDMYKLESELIGVKEAMERANKQKEQLRQSVWEDEAQLNSLYTQLEDSIAAYHISLSEIALAPEMEKHAAKLKVVLDKSQALETDQNKLLGVDLSSVVHPTLIQFKERLVARTNKAGQDYQQALDELDAAKQQFSECVEKLQILEAKKEKLEETMERERQTHEAKLALRLREVEAIESSVGSINDPVAMEGHLARNERQVTEMEALRLQKQEENLANKKAVEDEIAAACQAIMENETFMKAKAAEVSQYWLMKLTNVSNASVKSTEK
ncbi:Kinetochore protein NDC80 homolog [Seminavis robusta]|uniref:Kinetochore protein NDC80 n=1 Tax=Seminavis robusta TaxID=568900 RepID=A0A9N8HLD6_9STRA|nr:Kinetochore protein NDC80 homolog [Seminavis robusta]|eukprot:Sro675_g185480.1 Kinetochore protein NDC80 homolog (680) ;mRNA; r:25105-27249